MRYLFGVLFLLPFFTFSQDKHLDSLISVYTQAQSDTDRINKYSDIASYLINKKEYGKALSYYKKILQTFSKTYPQKSIDVKNKIAYVFISTEKFDKADSVIREIQTESIKLNYAKGLGFAKRNLGLLNTFKGNYKEAVSYHLKALKIWESLQNKALISASYSDLGIVFFYQGNYEKAIYYWENALKTAPSKNTSDYINNCGNLSSAYIELGKYDEATKYAEKAIEYYKSRKQDYTNALLNLANIEYKQKEYIKSLAHYAEIIQFLEKNNTRNKDIANVYLNAALIYQEYGKPKEALLYVQKGYEKAQASGDKNELLHAYNNMGSVYAGGKNFEKAFEYANLYNGLKDSLNSMESQAQINELDKQYQTEKKEKENQLLSKQLEIQQIQGKQQRFFLLVSVVVLTLIGFLSIVLYRQNKLKQKANYKLAVKNKIIEEQHKDITDSIKYAQRIQQAIFPPSKVWFDLVPQSFVLFKPKDVLSGDFYWIEQNKDYIYVAAADCTGHGVPGALMSIVNYNLLNKAVLEQSMTEPAKILDAVNKWLTVSLHQTYNESTVRDGMDIALCALNKKTNQLEFAGAFNGGYIFKQDKSVTELKGNKHPVGAFMEEKITSFTNHTLSLDKGDKIYIFSDGYADQFGGLNGKKLKYKKLQEFITESLHMPMPEQKKYLEQKFIDWKGDLEQIDDVLIIGILV
ncbi:MAG: tetratricopeptide repeat protein [Bacteroidia bacterium]